MSIELVFVKLSWLDFHGLDLLEILLVVEAVPQNIAKCAQRSLQAVCGCFFLCFLERRCFAFPVFDGPVTDILISSQTENICIPS